MGGFLGRCLRGRLFGGFGRLFDFLILLGGCLRVPGIPPGGGVTFCLRQKVTKNRFEYPRQNSASRRRRSVRTTAASQNFHKRCVTALRVARAASRDFARCFCASSVPNLTWFFGAGLLSEAGLWLVATTPRQPLRLGVEAADSTLVRQGFATTHEGLSWRPKTTDQSKP